MTIVFAPFVSYFLLYSIYQHQGMMIFLSCSVMWHGLQMKDCMYYSNSVMNPTNHVMLTPTSIYTILLIFLQMHSFIVQNVSLFHLPVNSFRYLCYVTKQVKQCILFHIYGNGIKVVFFNYG